MTASYQETLKVSAFAGHNAAYLEHMYELYLKDATLVDSYWQKKFEKYKKYDEGIQSHQLVRESIRLSHSASKMEEKVVPCFEDIYRQRGHRVSNLDPLGLWKRSDSYLESMGGQCKKSSHLKDIYCGSVGYEFMHLDDMDEKNWLIDHIESTPELLTHEDYLSRFHGLVRAELFEQSLGVRFVGQKRFSLEGCESLIPALDVIIEGAALGGCEDVVIGMAHRGRLNIMVNTLGLPFSKVTGLFEGKGIDLSYSGDVKYHLGCSSGRLIKGRKVHISLAYNPSHLEAIGPVVMGGVRARKDRKGEESIHDALGIIIHGDSAICGQGVVYECINMSYVPAYNVQGLIHIIVNNQVGFSTDPGDYKSGEYSSEVAKVIKAPVFHVNASDVDAVTKVAKLAIEYRNKFKKDVFIDLIGYRKYGHNEADEPSATQPIMYQAIRKYPGYHKIYLEKLRSKGIDQGLLEKATNDIKEKITQGSSLIENSFKHNSNREPMWQKYSHFDHNHPEIKPVSKKKILVLINEVNSLPEGFELQKQIKMMLEQRREMASGAQPMNWGFAEMVAYASLLDAGYHIRMAGQDVIRGTFFHRHAGYFDQNTGQAYYPLKEKYGDSFQVYNSVLSEYAALGFEYGYSEAYPDTLVIWEAQFGDFANGAQIIMDQFISSAWQKWQRMSGLVLLLPHGYEGQGPEHSSARMERYLQLCAQNNVRVCVPSTPGQMFHLLRSQVLQSVRCPLIIFTPKSMLRNPEAVSSLDDLTQGGFESILVTRPESKRAVKRVIMCSGKIYYDLLKEWKDKRLEHIIIVRIEQLYPFPAEALTACLEKHAKAQFIWCQEEPFNQGAWLMIRHKLMKATPSTKGVEYVGRSESASPASGYFKEHVVEQHNIVQQALFESM